MKFSQRIGKTSVRNAIQIESIDKQLENSLWDTIYNEFINKFNDDLSYSGTTDSNKCSFLRYIWAEFFNERPDEIPTNSVGGIHIKEVTNYIKEWFLKSQWDEKYDLIEFLSETFLSKVDASGSNIGFIEKCNDILKREMSAYRIINAKIVQIMSEEEIAEIEEALQDSSNWEPVHIHLSAALMYLSNRVNPDYRNSLKESISAVESFCKIITNDDTATLGKALNIVGSQHQIHGALIKAFTALYGYTCNSGGIRHSLLENDITVTMEDAKFMLVACSAFINYLKMKIEK